jgi:hypothetical protein
MTLSIAIKPNGLQRKRFIPQFCLMFDQAACWCSPG